MRRQERKIFGAARPNAIVNDFKMLEHIGKCREGHILQRCKFDTPLLASGL